MQIDLPLGVTASHLAATPSTMDAAQAYDGPAPHWILADTQTAGRGRRGRAWLPANGAFLASLVLHPYCTA
ncbi:MAG: biotin--[acetyl-CoA-carboxylase] ligase, partial [Pseudomonadota bacterium]